MFPTDARPNADTPFVYVGKDDDHIAIFRMDPVTAELSRVGDVHAGRHPSFLAFAPSKQFVYAVNEFSNELAAFSVDPRTGGLSLVNRVSSLGGEPAFVSVDASARWVLAANYRTGTVAVFPVRSDGGLGAPSDTKTTGQHPHAVRLDPSNRFAYVPNKGSDKISQFVFDPNEGKLVPNAPPDVATPAGSEPRHLAFHPSKNFVYVSEEAGCRIAVYARDPAGALTHVESIATLAPGAPNVSNTGSDVHVAPSGSFLYASNRGHDSVVIYAIGDDGRLTLVGHENTRGAVPRNFGIDPTGTFLFAANQGSGTVAAFRIDPRRGTLEHLRTTPMAASPYWVGVVALPGR